MKTFSINTLGCKINQYESQQIREMLEQFGLQTVEPPDKPDLVVINTCCVTHTASAKSRQYIQKVHKHSSNAAVIVCGCLPTVQIGELKAPGENFHLIKDRSDLIPVLSRIAIGNATAPNSQSPQSSPNNIIKSKNDSKIKHKNELDNFLKLPNLTAFKGQTRAFLKIQDGCDGYCTYCIVPKTRPFVRSKPMDEVLREAQALVEYGHREIVLSGIFLGAYGQPSVRRKSWPDLRNDYLAELLDKMALIPNLARIRLSSLEPADVTKRLIDTFCEHPNIMPHLHLPLQSGSNTILKRMCRQYRVEDFMQKVALIKSRLDRPAITTDIIVGFPGEMDDDFNQTVALAQDVGFAKMHVFSFSPRKGTAAAEMRPVLDNRIVKRRSQILRNLDIELGQKYRQQFIHENVQILIEDDNEQFSGRSERYFMVYIKDTKMNFRKNDLVNVRLVENSTKGIIGIPIY